MLKRKIVKLEGESVFDFLNKFNSDVVEHTALENPKFTNEANVSYLVKDDFGNGYVEVISDDLGKICKPFDVKINKNDLIQELFANLPTYKNIIDNSNSKLQQTYISYNLTKPFIYEVNGIKNNSLQNLYKSNKTNGLLYSNISDDISVNFNDFGIVGENYIIIERNGNFNIINELNPTANINNKNQDNIVEFNIFNKNLLSNSIKTFKFNDIYNNLNSRINVSYSNFSNLKPTNIGNVYQFRIFDVDDYIDLRFEPIFEKIILKNSETNNNVIEIFPKMNGLLKLPIQNETYNYNIEAFISRVKIDVINSENVNLPLIYNKDGEKYTLNDNYIYYNSSSFFDTVTLNLSDYENVKKMYYVDNYGNYKIDRNGTLDLSSLYSDINVKAITDVSFNLKFNQLTGYYNANVIIRNELGDEIYNGTLDNYATNHPDGLKIDENYEIIMDLKFIGNEDYDNEECILYIFDEFNNDDYRLDSTGNNNNAIINIKHKNISDLMKFDGNNEVTMNLRNY